MKKKIILTILVIYILFSLYGFYKWVKKERRKYIKTKHLPPHTHNDEEEKAKNTIISASYNESIIPKITDKCKNKVGININSSPGSIYEGVQDTTTPNVIKYSFYIILILLTIYFYFS